MNDLSLATPRLVDTVPAGLEEKLIWLCKFGKPDLSVVTAGWHARIKMNTNTTGSEFTVQSDFKMPTPMAALDQLIARMLDALCALNRGRS